MRSDQMYAFRRLRSVCVSSAALALLCLSGLPGRAAEVRAIVRRVAPVYPDLARRIKITGDVKVDATVNEDGKVTNAKAISGSKVLCFAAEEAVRKWKFASSASASHVEVSVKFEIAQ